MSVMRPLSVGSPTGSIDFFIKKNQGLHDFKFYSPILSMVTMFKGSNIRRMSIININCFKHFDMFVVEATDDYKNYLFLDGRFQE